MMIKKMRAVGVGVMAVAVVVAGEFAGMMPAQAQGGASVGRAATVSAVVLTEADYQQVLRDARLRRVGNYYLAQGCDDPLQVRMEAVDLNLDGRPEVVLTVAGSPCFSGVMQSNVSVYVRTSDGRWRDVLGFVPAFGVRVQSTRSNRYADLVLTVLGGCDPVYRWSGSNYIYATQLPAYDTNCHLSMP